MTTSEKERKTRIIVLVIVFGVLVPLIVIPIAIGLLVLLGASSAQRSAADTAKKADLTTVAAALESYYGENSYYPETNYANLPLLPKYLQSLPVGEYRYTGSECKNQQCQHYSLEAKLRAPSDRDYPVYTIRSKQ